MLVGPRKADEVRQSLSELYDNILAEYPRPILLFYGDDVRVEERNETGPPDAKFYPNPTLILSLSSP